MYNAAVVKRQNTAKTHTFLEALLGVRQADSWLKTGSEYHF